MTLYPEVQPLRQASREMVRELGFLQNVFTPAGMPHSHCHTLMETEKYGSLNQNELSERLCLDKSSSSRIVTQLSDQGLLSVHPDPEDKRRKLLSLTDAGRERLRHIHVEANTQVQSALEQLDPTEREQVLRGISLYSRALARSRRQSAYTIRAIQPEDAPGVANVIRRVMPEFGANGPGFAIHDAEVHDMYSAYTQSRSAYFVILDSQQKVVGGGGIAPLSGGDKTTCELRKMYFLPELRGLGLGQKIMNLCLEAAQKNGFSRCYLETLVSMKQARGLYLKNGFTPLDKPMGDTGHFSCNAWFLKELVAGG